MIFLHLAHVIRQPHRIRVDHLQLCAHDLLHPRRRDCLRLCGRITAAQRDDELADLLVPLELTCAPPAFVQMGGQLRLQRCPHQRDIERIGQFRQLLRCWTEPLRELPRSGGHGKRMLETDLGFGHSLAHVLIVVRSWIQANGHIVWRAAWHPSGRLFHFEPGVGRCRRRRLQKRRAPRGRAPSRGRIAWCSGRRGRRLATRISRAKIPWRPGRLLRCRLSA
mmetsp:Transcript_23810/g.54171  ORF Transcript_23810/g.54171 Transcript_23810/m.54171 type:complete len:222 (-) Transcript_23810:464-1129(-)